MYVKLFEPLFVFQNPSVNEVGPMETIELQVGAKCLSKRKVYMSWHYIGVAIKVKNWKSKRDEEELFFKKSKKKQ